MTFRSEPERRHELIVRLPSLTPEQAATLADALAPLARRCGGTLSEILRDRYPDHEMHVGRRRIV